jgi:hypothetical protein
MQTRGSIRIILLGACALLWACTARLCQAAPPGGVQKNTLLSKSVTQSPAQNPTHFPAARLDLRAPSPAAALVPNTSVFPSALIHRQIGGSELTAQLPSLGAGNPRIRPPLAELARHLQHEGLPVARLWENNSALVHIGLNQRGKPGLWLVQKIH